MELRVYMRMSCANGCVVVLDWYMPRAFFTKKKTLQLISTFSPLVTAQHTTCSNTRLVLLKMGIMMTEKCWGSIDNKHLTVASGWFSISLHNLLTMHGHRKLKIWIELISILLRLTKRSLFSNKHNGITSISISFAFFFLRNLIYSEYKSL